MQIINALNVELEPSDVARRLTLLSETTETVNIRLRGEAGGFKTGDYIDLFNASTAEFDLVAIAPAQFFSQYGTPVSTYTIEKDQEIRLSKVSTVNGTTTVDGWIIVPKSLKVSQLLDVEPSTPVDGNVLTFNSGKWEPLPPEKPVVSVHEARFNASTDATLASLDQINFLGGSTSVYFDNYLQMFRVTEGIWRLTNNFNISCVAGFPDGLTSIQVEYSPNIGINWLDFSDSFVRSTTHSSTAIGSVFPSANNNWVFSESRIFSTGTTSIFATDLPNIKIKSASSVPVYIRLILTFERLTTDIIYGV